MLYFDCHCEVGPRNEKDALTPWSTADVLRWMDHCGIDGALVSHTLAQHNDPVDARRLLRQELAQAPERLFPVWSWLPDDAGDFEMPDQFAALVRQDDVRAVRLFPKTHRYPFCLDVMGDGLRALEENRILTMIDFFELPGEPDAQFRVLREILTAFPNLPVLLLRAWWYAQRTVMALMRRSDNLFLEFSSYQNNRGIEDYVQQCGADRLLFGSGLPTMSAGAARAFIDCAMVPEETKAKIAGGNLVRLLRGQEPAATAPPRTDAFQIQAAQGRPLTGTLVLDAHCHILHEGGNGAGGNVMIGGDATGMVGVMDAVGIAQTAIMSWAGPVASEVPDSNDIVARAMSAYPDRYLGVAYINPTHYSAEEMMREVRLRVEEQGFVGLKPYIRTGIKYNDPLFHPCWDYANEHGLYALLHTEGAAGAVQEVVADMAARWPNAQWVVAHSGGSFGFARRVVGVMQQHPNVWAELTLTPVTNGVIEWMVSQVGDDRILFGTDAPMRDPRPQYGWVVWADLPEASRRKILGLNFQRLLAMRKTA